METFQILVSAGEPDSGMLAQSLNDAQSEITLNDRLG